MFIPINFWFGIAVFIFLFLLVQALSFMLVELFYRSWDFVDRVFSLTFLLGTFSLQVFIALVLVLNIGAVLTIHVSR